MKPKVLILTTLYDFAADLVCLRLENLDVPFLRINKENISDFEICLDPCEPSFNLVYRKKNVACSSELKSVWFRQPVFLRNTPSKGLSPAEQLCRSQWSAFLRALSVFDHIAWMNWPQATYLAESKPYQLLSAHRCGLSIPKTIVTNHAEAIKKNFATKIIVKSLDTVLLRDDDDCLFTYSNVCELEEISEENAKAIPFIAQNFIEPKTDCRVTIIGDHIHATRILKNGNRIVGDWRLTPKSELQYEDFELPESIKTSCLQLLRDLGLAFGAIDFVQTEDDFVFLEINPTGEWEWINSKERAFDEKIAEWLADG